MRDAGAVRGQPPRRALARSRRWRHQHLAPRGRDTNHFDRASLTDAIHILYTSRDGGEHAARAARDSRLAARPPTALYSPSRSAPSPTPSSASPPPPAPSIRSDTNSPTTSSPLRSPQRLPRHHQPPRRRPSSSTSPAPSTRPLPPYYPSPTTASPNSPRFLSPVLRIEHRHPPPPLRPPREMWLLVRS